VVFSGDTAVRAPGGPSVRNYRVRVALVVIVLLYSRFIVLKYLRLRGSKDAEALSCSFRECNHYAPRGFFNADRVKACSAPNLVVQDLADRDVFAVYYSNIARDVL